jgi:hypothetical protein
MPRFDPPIELRHVSEHNLRESVASMSGYPKFASMVWIRALRQPILDGLFVKRWGTGAARAVKGFCERHGRDELLLRVDALDRRWSQRRGGYIIRASEARAAVRELNREGTIAAFLEPASPYRDRYCLAAITDGLQETMTVEVVGPGFDTSDLLRGDSSPHERFRTLVSKPSRPHQNLAYERHPYVISTEDYRHSVEGRLVKIGARLRNPAYPRLVIDAPASQRRRLAEEAIDYLEKTKQRALLDHLGAYEPLPRHLAERFIAGVGSIVEGLSRYNIRLGPTSFAGTFTQRGRLVFWDFFPADLTRANELYLGS